MPARKKKYTCSQDGSFEAALQEASFVGKVGVAKVSTADDAVSPMPGVVDKVFVKVGDVVAAGDALMVVIAMKMEVREILPIIKEIFRGGSPSTQICIQVIRTCFSE